MISDYKKKKEKNTRNLEISSRKIVQKALKSQKKSIALQKKALSKQKSQLIKTQRTFLRNPEQAMGRFDIRISESIIEAHIQSVDPNTPVIESVTPDHGKQGSWFSVIGRNLTRTDDAIVYNAPVINRVNRRISLFSTFISNWDYYGPKNNFIFTFGLNYPVQASYEVEFWIETGDNKKSNTVSLTLDPYLVSKKILLVSRNVTFEGINPDDFETTEGGFWAGYELTTNSCEGTIEFSQGFLGGECSGTKTLCDDIKLDEYHTIERVVLFSEDMGARSTGITLSRPDPNSLATELTYSYGDHTEYGISHDILVFYLKGPENVKPVISRK